MRKKLWVLFVLAVTLAAADSAYMSKHKSQRSGSQLVTVSATAEPSPNFTISTEPIFNSYQTDRFVAHRGLSDHAPENTVPAFELAGKAGFWGIETDIIETLDGVFMCMHDDELDRTTNGSGMVIDHTYNELSQLCVDYGNDISDYPDLKIPTMIEFLNMCVIYDCVPVIEIKQIDNYEAFLKTIEESGLMNRCIISGGIEDLKQIRALNTSIPLMVVGYSNKPYTFYTELIKELPDNSERRIFVFDRASQFELLSQNPECFMWVSPIPEELLLRYGLTERSCDENGRVYKDVLIYRKDYKLTATDDIFISELCKAKRRVFGS